MVPRIGCSTSKVATIFVGIETLSRLSIFRSMVEAYGRPVIINITYILLQNRLE